MNALSLPRITFNLLKLIIVGQPNIDKLYELKVPLNNLPNNIKIIHLGLNKNEKILLRQNAD